MPSHFNHLFQNPTPVIACIHLQALPGAPLYDGNLETVYETALNEAKIYQENNVDGIIIENFGDKPFFPTKVPAETIAAMSVVAREVINQVNIPVGINVLRNDAESAIAIATAVQADFIRVNAHIGSIVSDQGLIDGVAHNTLRLRSHLKSNVAIFADVGVKHAAPLADRGLANEVKDIQSRGLVDAIIVSGDGTGEETAISDLELVKEHSKLPLLIGSGATADNLRHSNPYVDGYIVGTYFKEEGKSENPVSSARVSHFVKCLRA